MSSFVKAFMALVAVLAVGVVGASAAQAGIVNTSLVGVNGSGCNIEWAGASLVPPATNVKIPAGQIQSSNCPPLIASATNQTDLYVSTTSSDLTLNSGVIRVTTNLLSRCDIAIISPVSIPSTGTNQYAGNITLPSANLSFTPGGLPPNPCPVAGDVLNLGIDVN